MPRSGDSPTSKGQVAAMVRGSVVAHRRRCGKPKPSCRCASGEVLHESVVISYSEASRTKFVMLRPEEVELVRAAAERYREARATLEAIFGTGTVTRLAYRAKGKGAENLHLQDAALNLPRELHSHGLRQLAAIEAARGSYEEAQTGMPCGFRIAV